MAQTHTIGKTATSVRTDGETTIVRYHNTDVVEVTPITIKLNTGGWYTLTTKTRMNQASNQFNLGYQVYQKKGDWFVSFMDNTIPLNRTFVVIDRRTGKRYGD